MGIRIGVLLCDGPTRDKIEGVEYIVEWDVIGTYCSIQAVNMLSSLWNGMA